MASIKNQYELAQDSHDDTAHADKGLLVDSGGSAVAATPTTVGNGSKTVTTAGTRLALASTTACKSVVVQAKRSSTGYIYVGGATVSATSGVALTAGESLRRILVVVATGRLKGGQSLACRSVGMGWAGVFQPRVLRG